MISRYCYRYLLTGAVALSTVACNRAGVEGVPAPGSEGLPVRSAIINPSADPPAPTLGTADVQRLDMEFGPADPAGTIAEEVALAAGESINDFSNASGPPTAFLATVVDAGGGGQGSALAGRRVWVIRYSGVDLEIPGPSVPAPATARSHTARYAYVFLDAVSGQFLLTTLSE